MRVTKKVLSVFLAMLMAFSCVTAALPSLVAFAADGDTPSYSRKQVQDLIADAVSSANAYSASGDTWTYSGSDNAVWAAADAVYYYALENADGYLSYKPNSGGNTSTYPAFWDDRSDALAAAMVKDLGYTTGSAEAVFITNLINPNNGGTPFCTYASPSKKTGNFNGSNSYSKNQELTHHDSVPYNTIADVVKTITVNRNLNDYLMTFESIEELPDTINLTVTYRYTNTGGYNKAQPGTGNIYAYATEDSKNYWVTKNTKYASWVWHYLSTMTRAESNPSDAKAVLTAERAYFAGIEATTVTDFLTDYDLNGLLNLKTSVTNRYNTLTGKYSTDVVTKFVGDLDSFLKNLQEAIDNLYDAAVNMRTMIKYINDGFEPITVDNVESIDISDYNALYSLANAAYEAVKDIPDATIESVKSAESDLASFSKAACVEFLADLNESICIYNAVQIKADIESYFPEPSATISDPLVGEDVLSNRAVFLLKDQIVAILTGFNNLTVDSRNIVFGGTSYDKLDTLVENIFKLCDVRSAGIDYDENFYQYFYPKMTANIGAWKNADATALYDEGVEKRDAFTAAYADYIADLGSEIVNEIFFDVVMNGESVSLADGIAIYLESLKNNIIARNEAQLDKVADFAGLTEIDFTNFSAAKQAVAGFDSDLYDFCLEKGWVSERYIAIHTDSFEPVNALVTAFKESGGIPYDFVSQADENGVFCVREGGMTGDIARVNGEDYVVNKQNVEETLVKLDNFLASQEFCDLVGFENKETGVTYASLGDAIDALIKENLFTDEMINMLLAMLYPMLVDTISGLLKDLPSLGVAGITAPEAAGSVATIDLGVLAPDAGATGKLQLYIDGVNGSAKLVNVFETLGIYIYPQSLAKKLDAYPEAQAALTAAGLNWSRVTKNVDYTDEDGNLIFDWGINACEDPDVRYQTFLQAAGIIFDSLLPLLDTLLNGVDYQKSVNSLAAVSGKVSYSIFSNVTVNPSVASATISITGQDLYGGVLIPLMEALGVTDANPDYRFPTLDTSSGKKCAEGIFDPILELIDQLKKQPVDKVLSILPSLVYALSMDKVKEMLNGIVIPLSVKLNVDDLDLGGLYSLVEGIVKSVLNNNLSAFGFELKLGDMLKLDELLGFDYTNINALAAFLFEKLDLPLELPYINADLLILASHYDTEAASYRSSGKRLKLTPDKAEEFYVILNYLMRVVGDSEFLNGIISFIKNSDGDADGSDDSDDLLSTILDAVCSNIGGNTDAALAALIELFNPRTYQTATMDWAQVDLEYTTDINNFGPKSIPYLKYANDWNRGKSEYLLDNVDEILDSVLMMLGNTDKSEYTSVNELLSVAIEGLFNNKNLTAIMKGLTGLGYLLKNQTIYDLLAGQIGVDLQVWARTFTDLFPELLTEEYPEAESLQVTSETVNPGKTITGVSGTVEEVLNEETGETEKVYTWYINGEAFVDGDRDQFLDIFLETCREFAPILSMMLDGDDFTMFADALTIKGYPNYVNTFGIFFEILGFSELYATDPVKYASFKVLTQEEFSAMDSIAAFDHVAKQLFDWVEYILDQTNGGTLTKIVELIPRFTYFVQSNGVATVLHNMLMPILVVVDTIRPLINIDINTVLSVLVSDILNGISDSLNAGESISLNIDVDHILAAVFGNGVTDENPNHKLYQININRLTVDSILNIVDLFIGTDLANSNMITLGVNAVCADPKEMPSVLPGGVAYGSTVTAADAITILICSLLETLEQEITYVNASGNSENTTNGERIVNFIQPLIGDSFEIMPVYKAVMEILKGLDYDYQNPDWGYMFTGNLETYDNFHVELPEHSIVYLGYSNDWKKENAEKLDESLDALVALLMDSLVGDSDLVALLNGILEDKVYTDANLNTIVELIVNAISALDETLRTTIDVTLDTKIADWFAMCTLVTDEDGNTSYVCTENWGVDAAAEGEKKQVFIDSICDVLAPANELVAWLFLGRDIRLFTGSEKDAEGNYIFNDIITVKGGQGYAYGIVPILEAFDVKGLKPADQYIVDGKYDATACVNDILNALLNRVDEIAGKPAHEVIELLPNIIYFLNANGLSAACNSLLAPVNSILAKVAPAIDAIDDDATLASLLYDTIGFDFSDLSMDALLNILVDKTGIVLSDEMKDILTSFMIGELSQFESANGEYAYRMTYTDAESRADMITIILSFALDLVKENQAFFGDLLGDKAEILDTVLELIKGAPVGDPTDPDWFYMVDEKPTTDEEIAAILADANLSAANISYIQKAYGNDANFWTKETATSLNAILVDLVNQIISDATAYENMNDLFNTLFKDGKLYSEYNLNKLGFIIGNLLESVDELYLDLVGAILGVDLSYYKQFKDPDKLSDSKIEEMRNNILTNDEFATRLADMLSPVSVVLDWLLFGRDYKVLLDNKANDAIRLNGADGYSNALVPLLEALDIQAPAADENDNFSTMAVPVFKAIMAKVDEVCNAAEGTEALQVILDLLPNIVYFINANGLGTVVNNLLLPVNALFEAASPLTGLEGNVQDLVNGLIAEKLDGVSIDLNDIRFNVVSDVVNALIGIDIQAAIEEDTYNHLDKLFVGELTAYESAAGKTAYKAVNTPDAQRDLLAAILCAALDVVKADGNAKKIDKLLGKDNEVVQSVVGVLGGLNYGDPMDINWFYMADAEPSAEELEAFLQNSEDLSGATLSYILNAYTKEGNLWTTASAEFLSANLVRIIDLIVKAKKDGADLNTVLNQEFAKGRLYSEYNIQKLGYMIGELLKKLPDAYKDVAGILLELDLDYYKQFDKDPDEELKDVILSNEEFAHKLADMLRPIETILDWLLFGKDATFLYDKKGGDAITLKGNNGYQTGLAPILEALQIANLPAITPDSDFDNMAEPVFLAIMGKIDEVCNAGSGNAAIQIMLNHIPNIIYFMNADGLTAAVNNLLLGVNALFSAVAPLTGMEGNVTDLLNKLIADKGISVDLNDISFKTVSDILVATLDLNIQDAVRYETWNAMDEIYVGKLESYLSETGKPAYIAKNTATAQRDVLTVILCAALDVLKYEDNKDRFENWFGKTTYAGIMNVFALEPITTHQQPDWLFVDDNGISDAYKDKPLSPMADCSGTFDYGYDQYWTREKAKYVAANLNDFVNNTMELVGVQNSDGDMMNSIGAVVDSLVGENLYTNENAAKLAKLVADLIAQVAEYEDGLIVDAVREVLNIDLAQYEKYAGGDYDFGIETGDSVAFMDAIVELLAPVAPILRVVLTGDNLTLLVDKEGNDAVTVYGAEGYKYAIIPLLEAFDHNNPAIMTADAYAAAAENDDDALIRNILVPVFSVLDFILEDPLNNILEVLPGVVYFINSNGVDTVVKNLIAPINNVLEAISPITGKTDLYQILGFDLSTIDMRYLLNMLTDLLNDALGDYAELVPPVMNAVVDMTVGKVVPFTSKNGDQAYTMVYVEDEQSLAGKADMVTVILRFAMNWVVDPENQETVTTFLKQNIPDAETQKYVLATYETLVSYVDKPNGVNMMLGVLYYIFYGVDAAVDGVHGAWSDTNSKWSFIMGLFDDAESDYLKGFADTLNTIFGVTDGVIDQGGIASDGFVTFFQKIINWFKSIIEWFKGLFG